jgi:hypothetical protein
VGGGTSSVDVDGDGDVSSDRASRASSSPKADGEEDAWFGQLAPVGEDLDGRLVDVAVRSAPPAAGSAVHGGVARLRVVAAGGGLGFPT